MLIPSQSLTFLGLNLNSVSMTVTLTQEMRDQLEPLCAEAMNREDFSIRFVAMVIGKVVGLTCPPLPPGSSSVSSFISLNHVFVQFFV